MISTLLLCAIQTGAASTAETPLPPRLSESSPMATGVQGDGTKMLGRVSRPAAGPAILENEQQIQVNLQDLSELIFPDPSPIAADSGIRVRFGPTQSLVGDITNIDSENVSFRSVFGEHQLQRSDVSGLFHLGSGQVLFQENFSNDLQSWKTVGVPTTSDQRFLSPPKSLLLTRVGQQALITIKQPSQVGRVQFSFFDQGNADTREFRATLLPKPETSPTVELALGPTPNHYTVQFPESLKIPALAVARRPGWHRTVIDFGPDWLVVTVDGAALVSSFHRGVSEPLGTLVFSVTSATNAGNKPESNEPLTWIDDVSWTTSTRSSRPGDLVEEDSLIPNGGQYRLMTLGGDEWSAPSLVGDSRQVELEIFPGFVRAFPWNTVQSVRFAARPVFRSRTLVGEIGELELASGDLLVASLKTIVDGNWTIEHPLLGELTIPESRLKSWRPLVFGTRIEAIPGIVHLGTKLVDDFEIPQPTGTTTSFQFQTQQAVEGPFVLRLRVRGMEAQLPLAPFEHTLKRGGLRTEVWLNGKKVDYLNHYLTDRTPTEEIRVPLSSDDVRAGENELQLRLVADPATGEFDEVEVSDVAIEQAHLSAKADKTP